jgi:transposase
MAMEVIYDRIAGLDIGKASVTVCVRTPSRKRGSRHTEIRTFPTMTRSLQVMADWLVEQGVTIAAMESTATYWKPVFYCLEERMECWLLNAAHMKVVPGLKTDVRDAQWIAELLEHGLLRPSFLPPPPIRQLRMLTRYRVQLMGDRTRDATRLEQMLEDASIKLSVVSSTLTTVSAKAMLRGLIAGEGDPAVLAQLARGKMRSKIPELTEALTGRFDADHAQLASSMLARLEQVDADVAALDRRIVAACRPWQHQIDLLCTIPGVSTKVAAVIIAETGGDMSRFPTAGHLCAWAGVVPAVYASAGKRSPAGHRKGNKWLCSMLVEASTSAARTKETYLAARYRRLARRRGAGKAQLANAHSMLISAYHMLARDVPYRDLGPDWNKRQTAESRTKHLVAELEKLGHTVSLETAA